jgi:transcriptional regulator with XRE-family HTH domain
MDLPSGRELKAGRTLAGFGLNDFAKRLGVSTATLRRLEETGPPPLLTKAIFELRAAGVEFLSDGGVRLRKDDDHDVA